MTKSHGSKNTGRFSSPTRIVDNRRVIDVDNYVPYFFASINNALSRGASQLYLDAFGVGIVEWRIISILATEPKIQAQRVCDVVDLDKSSTSRGLKSLLEKGYVEFSEPERDTRRRVWWLNDKGFDLHENIITIALDRERRLLHGVDAADLEIALRVMRQMRENIQNQLSSG